MKKLLLLLAISCFCLVSIGGDLVGDRHPVEPVKKVTYVYICNSSGAYAYHSTESCRGLNRCSHGVLKVTLSDAVHKYGRRPCKICE